MASDTPNLALRKPDPADRVNVTTDLSDNYDRIDSGVALVGHVHNGTYVAVDSQVVNVKDHGVTGDGATDDTTALNAAIAASAAGSVIYFPPGTYLVSATIELLSSRSYVGSHYTSGSSGAVIKQKNGANIANAMVASYGWFHGQNFTGTPVEVRNLTFDGNKANNGSSTASCLVLMNFLSLVEDNVFVNSPAHGLLISDQALDGTSITNTQVENRIQHNKAITPTGHGFWVNDLAGNKNTDGFMIDNIVQTPGLRGIRIDRSAGWKVAGNHVYGCGSDGISCDNAFATRILDNYVEGFGLTANAESNLFHVGISARVSSTRGALVANNQIYQGSDPANGNTFHYLAVTGLTNPSYGFVRHNDLYGVSNANHIGLVMQNSGGALLVSLGDNQVTNFSATKVEFIASGVTTTSARRYGRQQITPIVGNAINIQEWYKDISDAENAVAPLAKVDSAGLLTAVSLIPSGLTGATAASRYVGATASGAPASGTFAVGDFVVDRAGKVWVCTAAGTPGTWVDPTAANATALAALAADPFGIGFATTVDPRIAGSSTVAPGANNALFGMFTGYGQSTNQLRIHIGAQSGNICVAVYAGSGSGSSRVPAARRATTGSIACPAPGVNTVTLTSTITINAGDFGAVVADNGTVTFGRNAPTSGNISRGVAATQATAFPLPDPAVPTNGSASVPWVATP